MNFFDHTLNWLKGEMSEAIIITGFGALALVSGFLLWKYAMTPYGRALVIPTLVVAVLLTGVGISMYLSNQSRVEKMRATFEEGESEFIQAEKKRVEDFQYLYTVSKVIATVSFVVAIIAFWFFKSPVFQSISIGLLVLGVAGLVIDYFSEERARIYYETILKALE